MKRKSLVLTTFILLLFLLVSSFQKSDSNNNIKSMEDTSNYKNAAFSYSDSNLMGVSKNSVSAEGANSSTELSSPYYNYSSDVPEAAKLKERKLIKTIFINAETKDFENCINNLKNKTNLFGGYIENQSIYGQSTQIQDKQQKNANFTIRVPEDKVDNFLNDISGSINVISKSENTEDISLTYSDSLLKRESLLLERKKLTELMEKATVLEDIIKIEERLSQVTLDIQKIETRLRNYDNKVEYTTIILDIKEVIILTPTEDTTITQKIKVAFVKNLNEAINLLKKLTFNFITHIPFIILFIIIVLIIVLILKLIFYFVKKFNSKNKSFKQKNKNSQSFSQLEYKEGNGEDEEQIVKRKRGRPRKIVTNTDIIVLPEGDKEDDDELKNEQYVINTDGLIQRNEEEYDENKENKENLGNDEIQKNFINKLTK